MSYITPKTNIYLYSNCPLPSNYEHTFYFANESAQTSYFAGLNSTLYSNNTYQVMSSGVIRIKDSIDNLYNKSYMSFVNTKSNGVGFENKTYYCFVTDVIYINNGTTEIHYTIDVMQTYLFQYKTGDGLGKKMFVDRNHIPKSDDTMQSKYSQIEEPLDTGSDYVYYDTYKCFDGRQYTALVIYSGVFELFANAEIVNREEIEWGSNYPPAYYPIYGKVWDANWGDMRCYTTYMYYGGSATHYVFAYRDRVDSTNNIYDYGIPNCLTVKEIDITDSTGALIVGGTMDNNGVPSFDGYLGLQQFLNGLSIVGKLDSVVRIMLVPKDLLSRGQISNLVMDGNKAWVQEFTDMDKYGAYEPKNKKTCAYPYSFIKLDNNEGVSKVYKPQLLTEYKFKAQRSIWDGCAVVYPTEYLYSSNLLNLGVTKNFAGELPYNYSHYANWLANTSVARNINKRLFFSESVMKLGSGIISNKVKSAESIQNNAKSLIEEFKNRGGGTLNLTGVQLAGNKEYAHRNVGTLLDTLSEANSKIGSALAEKASNEAIPLVAKGAFENIFSYACKMNGFTLSRMGVGLSVAKRIDNYFSVYGYKISDWQVPKLKVRSKWTFIKTAGCAIKANNIPTQFEDVINQIFDNGITFWNDTTNFMDYGDFSNPD